MSSIITNPLHVAATLGTPTVAATIPAINNNGATGKRVHSGPINIIIQKQNKLTPSFNTLLESVKVDRDVDYIRVRPVANKIQQGHTASDARSLVESIAGIPQPPKVEVWRVRPTDGLYKEYYAIRKVQSQYLRDHTEERSGPRGVKVRHPDNSFNIEKYLAIIDKKIDIQKKINQMKIEGATKSGNTVAPKLLLVTKRPELSGVKVVDYDDLRAFQVEAYQALKFQEDDNPVYDERLSGRKQTQAKNNARYAKSQLNGSHGEYTNTDDLRRVMIKNPGADAYDFCNPVPPSTETTVLETDRISLPEVASLAELFTNFYAVGRQRYCGCKAAVCEGYMHVGPVIDYYLAQTTLALADYEAQVVLARETKDKFISLAATTRKSLLGHTNAKLNGCETPPGPYECPLRRVVPSHIFNSLPKDVDDLVKRVLCNTLNGSNGEVTGDDDRGGRKKSGVVSKKAMRAVAGVAKTMARRQGKAMVRKVTGFSQNEVNSGYRNLTLAMKRMKSDFRSPAPRTMPSAGRTLLSAVASQYLLSQIAPFDPRCDQAHIPRFPSRESYKVKGFFRTPSLAVGTAGAGFVSVSPCLCNDFAFGWYSGNGFTDANGTVSMPTAANANNVFAMQMTNLPFSTSQLTSTTAGGTIDGRIVSFGFRVVYTGTSLNRGGLFYAYVDSNNDSVVGMSAGAASAKDNADILSIGAKNEVCQVVVGVKTLDFDYVGGNASVNRTRYPFTQGTTALDANSGQTVSAPLGAIWVTGTNGNTFYVESVCHAEFIGPGVPQSLLSRSESDETGFDMVQGIAGRMNRLYTCYPSWSFIQVAKKAIQDSAVTMHPSYRLT